MKKVFKPAQVEIVNLSMADMIADSQGVCDTYKCGTEGTAKDDDWDLDEFEE